MGDAALTRRLPGRQVRPGLLAARDVRGRCGLTRRLPRREVRPGLLTARDVRGRCGRRGRGRQQRVAEGRGGRRDDEQAGDKDPGDPTGRCSCWFAVRHASSLGERGVASAYVIFDMPDDMRQAAFETGVFYGDVPCYTAGSDAITAGWNAIDAASERPAFLGRYTETVSV